MGELEEVKKKIEKEETGALKEKTEEPEKKIELPEEFRSTIARATDLTFKVLAKRYGKKWILSEDELKDLTGSYIALLEKYTPAIVSRFSVEVNALFWTTYIVAKRIS